MNYTKMYILVRAKAPKGWGVNAVGHAALLCYLKYKEDPDMLQWVDKSFRKVTCLVSDEEFNLAKKAGNFVVFKENDLDGMVCAMAFKPRKNYPCYFNGFKLYS